MKKTNLFFGVVIFIFLIPVIFYLCFAVGMISTNRPKAIKLNWVKQYKTIIKKDFSYINDVNIYYQQGRVRFDFTTSHEIALQDCKQITKVTKDFIEKETLSKPLMDNGYDQLSIRLKFDINNDNYVFESPYWVDSEDTNDNPNIFVKNTYRTWHFNINDVLQTKLEF